MKQELIKNFLDTVLNYRREFWQTIEDIDRLPAEKINLMLEVIEMAGFVIHGNIVVGKARVRYEIRPGTYVDPDDPHDYVVNKNLSFYVCKMNSSEVVCEDATIWLDKVFELIWKMSDEEVTFVDMVEKVKEKIMAQNVVRPIRVSEFDETIVFSREHKDEDGFKVYFGDDQVLYGTPYKYGAMNIGFFQCSCGNKELDRMSISGSHTAFICKNCLLRVIFPNFVKTVGELRKYFQLRLP